MKLSGQSGQQPREPAGDWGAVPLRTTCRHSCCSLANSSESGQWLVRVCQVQIPSARCGILLPTSRGRVSVLLAPAKGSNTGPDAGFQQRPSSRPSRLDHRDQGTPVARTDSPGVAHLGVAGENAQLLVLKPNVKLDICSGARSGSTASSPDLLQFHLLANP